MVSGVYGEGREAGVTNKSCSGLIYDMLRLDTLVSGSMTVTFEEMERQGAVVNLVNREAISVYSEEERRTIID